MSASTTNRSMRYLRVDDTELRYAAMNRSGLTVSRLACAREGHGPSDPHALEGAFLVALQLADYRGELWRNGRRVPTRMFGAGEFTVYDYRERWRANLLSRFDCMNFHVPLSSFDATALELRRPVDRLDVAPGVSVRDTVVENLASALLSATVAPQEASRVFTDHVEMALLVHLATRYGASAPLPTRHAGGLAPAQLRMATEMLADDLMGRLSITDIAAACGLSSGYFIKAFKVSTGLPPHRWLQRRRVQVAMQLLAGSTDALSDVASACGFADQSHFTRVFLRIAGVTPGAYRSVRGPAA